MSHPDIELAHGAAVDNYSSSGPEQESDKEDVTSLIEEDGEDGAMIMQVSKATTSQTCEHAE